MHMLYTLVQTLIHIHVHVYIDTSTHMRKCSHVFMHTRALCIRARTDTTLTHVHRPTHTRVLMHACI